jgi:hypothetical protein
VPQFGRQCLPNHQVVDMEDVKITTPTGPWILDRWGSHTTVQVDFGASDGSYVYHLGLDPFNAGFLPDALEAGASRRGAPGQTSIIW